MKTREKLLRDPLASTIRQKSVSHNLKPTPCGPSHAPCLKTCGRCSRELELYYYNSSPDNPNLKMPICIKCTEEVEAIQAARGVKQPVFTTEIKREYKLNLSHLPAVYLLKSMTEMLTI
jgi:hypothetical protein